MQDCNFVFQISREADLTDFIWYFRLEDGLEKTVCE